METNRCDRCNSIIVQERFAHGQYEHFSISRWVSENEWESETVTLCSMCWDDMWEWAFESDVDRSDKADPLPLDKMAQSVRRHIDALESVLDSLSEAKV